MMERSPVNPGSSEFSRVEYMLQLSLKATTARLVDAFALSNPHQTMTFEKQGDVCPSYHPISPPNIIIIIIIQYHNHPISSWKKVIWISLILCGRSWHWIHGSIVRSSRDPRWKRSCISGWVVLVEWTFILVRSPLRNIDRRWKVRWAGSVFS